MGTAGGLISFLMDFCAPLRSFESEGDKRDEKMHPKNEVSTRRGWGKGVWVRLASNRFKRAKGRGREVRRSSRHQVASRRRDATQPGPLAQNTKMVVARRGRKKERELASSAFVWSNGGEFRFPLIWSRIHRT